jgi:hypothetical protein
MRHHHRDVCVLLFTEESDGVQKVCVPNLRICVDYVPDDGLLNTALTL